MRKKSHHMTYIDRQKLEVLYNNKSYKYTQKEISQELGFSQQNISKEIKRGIAEQLDGNTWLMYKIYSADKAQANADYQKTAKGAPIKLGHDRKLAEYIEDKILNHHYSPYAILKEIEFTPELIFDTTLSISTIYNYVASGIFLHVKPRHLLRMKRKKKQPEQRVAFKNILKPCISIRDALRHNFGHWEMDTVIGKAKGENNVLLVLTERKTRYEIVIKIHRKKSIYVVNALRNLRRKYKNFKSIFKTITVDNGAEFSDYSGMAKLTDIYYCHPYSSWERGSNENANAIIRRFIPKGIDMNKITHNKVKYVQDWINNYPRKILNNTAQKAFDYELSLIL